MTRSMPRAAALSRLVHDARAMEMRGKFGVVGDVVAVREEHEIDAAHFLDAFHERIVETRRIDEDISALLFRAHDQVRPRAEARFRSEAAKINVIHDVGRKSFDAGAGAAAGHCADGSGRAGDQRHEARGAVRRDFAAGGRRSICRRDRESSPAQSGGTRRNRCNSRPRRIRLPRFAGAARQSAPWMIRFLPAPDGRIFHGSVRGDRKPDRLKPVLPENTL